MLSSKSLAILTQANVLQGEEYCLMFAKMSAIVAMIAALGLTACQNPGPALLDQLAGSRLVLAARGPNNHLEIRMSPDGLVWTEPIPVTVNGTPVQVAGALSISHDGTLYHLFWEDPNGDVRYGTSRTATSWLVQDAPLTRLPRGVSFANGGGVMLAAEVNASRDLVVQDLSSSPHRIQIAHNMKGPASIAFGLGKFVIAAIDAGNHIQFFESRDGFSWSPTSTLGPSNNFWAQISFAENTFLLAAKRLPSVCRLLHSSDGQQWVEDQVSGCSNSSTGIFATRLRGDMIFLENFNNQLLSVQTSSRAMSNSHVKGLINQFAVVPGPGPQIAGLRFDQLTINRGSDQNVMMITLGFRVRVGVPNSAHVTFADWPEEFVQDLDAGHTAPIPAHVSPFAWQVERAVNLNQDDGQIDILGVAVVGLDHGDCPTSGIVSSVNQSRAALETALEQNMARGRLADLKDPSTRQRVISRVRQQVQGGGSSGIFSSLLETVGCLFNHDDRFNDSEIVMLGIGGLPSLLSPTPNPATSINLELDPSTPDAAISQPLVLQKPDGSKQWAVDGRLFFIGLP
jgi:hypothetical protein